MPRLKDLNKHSTVVKPFARKNLIQPPAVKGTSTTTTAVGATQQAEGPRGEETTLGNRGPTSASRKLAEKSLGFADAPTQSAKTNSASTAKAGLSFMQRAKKKMSKGLLAGLTGLMLFSAVGPGIQATMNVTMHTRPTVERVMQYDVRAFQMQRQGESAFSDAQRLVNEWHSQGPNYKIEQQHVTSLLLAALLPAVPDAGEDLVTFATKNLGNDTKELIKGVLDGGRFEVTAEARRALDLVSGRIAAATVDGRLTVIGDQAGEKITLKGTPGASIEVINLSTIPTKRLHTDDTFVLGTIGADGAFSGPMEMSAGDLIRMRLKIPEAAGTAASVTEWVDFRASGLGLDTRNAEVALFRIGLSEGAGGQIDVKNINTSRPVSEPGAVVRFVNERTSEVADIKFDKNGTFPDSAKIPGKAGDTFSVRVTDGTNDLRLETEISKVKVGAPGRPSVVEFDIADPTLHSDELDAEGKPRFSLERYRGPLFEAAANHTDVTQGQIGDCYFPAAISSIAFHIPGTFEKIIQQKEEVDATTGQSKIWYEVTFKERDWSARGGDSKYKDVVVKVDGDLYIRSWGGPLYGADDTNRTPEDMELWFSILEKAYAQWKGASYESIGNGGHVSEVFRDILGVDATQSGLYDKDATWKRIVDAVDAKRPVGAGTHHDDSLYPNTGVYGDHAYSILGYKEEGGVKYVQLRNPWGESEPYPYSDGKNDGIFHLKLDDFMKLYSQLYYVTGD